MSGASSTGRGGGRNPARRELGVNLFDTAQGYGFGHLSGSLVWRCDTISTTAAMRS
ncbi:MAG: hypothetical protein WB507_11270 [Solirubrobacterales bacterium]